MVKTITDDNNQKLIDEFHKAVKGFKSKGFYVESNLALHNNGRIHIGITVTNSQEPSQRSMPTTKLIPKTGAKDMTVPCIY